MSCGHAERRFERHDLGDTSHRQQQDDGRADVGRYAVVAEDGGDGIELQLTESLRVARDLVTDGFAVVGQGDELDVQGCPAEVGAEPPQRPKRAVHLQRPGECVDTRFRAAAVDLEEEVVHAAEVVVHQLRLDAGLGGDASRCHGRVALPEHQPLRRVEQARSGLRVGCAEPSRRAPRSIPCQVAGPHARHPPKKTVRVLSEGHGPGRDPCRHRRRVAFCAPTAAATSPDRSLASTEGCTSDG